MRSPRALIVVVLGLLAAVGALAGGVDVLLAMAPLLALMGMLACGRYLGEEQILRRRTGAAPARRDETAPWQPRRTLVRAELARAAITRRGPPGVALA